MKKILRFFTSISIAILTALILSSIVQAGGPYIISEATILHFSGNNGYPHSYSSSGCYNGTCKYLSQSEPTEGWYWPNGYSNFYQWYAYDPTVGQAAAYYTVWESGSYYWTVTVNQANHHGQWVYLGYSDYPGDPGEHLVLDNRCISGYTCSSLNIYWDEMELTTH
jgi:hypothetical protein